MASKWLRVWMNCVKSMNRQESRHMPQITQSFSGFSPESLQFLIDLRSKNSKTWFEENRTRYNNLLLNPFRMLVSGLSPLMLAIDENFETKPAINKTISKIFRDTRFSNDKSLFRSEMWLVFKRPGKEWQDAPGFFFELTPASWRYGMGYYLASRNTMDALRDFINESPEQFLHHIAFFTNQQTFTLEGEKYKRPLPCQHSNEIREWYQRRNFFLVANREISKTLFSAELVTELSEGFQMVGPLYQFLRGLKGENI